MTDQFIHLHVHSEYSIVDGIVRIPALLQQAKELNMPAAAVTDQSNLFGMVKFYRAALAAGVKPIIGCDVWVENPEDQDKPFRLVLLCQNTEGYKNLIKLISRAYVENQHLDKSIVKRSWFAENANGLIALSAGLAGDIGNMLLANNQQVAKEYLRNWMELFPERFYLELQRTGRAHEEEYINQALSLAIEFKAPVVATNDVCFIRQNDFEAHEARVCIHGGWLLNDARRPRDYSNQQYLRTSSEMIKLFSDIPSAIENTVEIAKRCSLILGLDQNFLPDFPVPEKNMSTEEYFAKTSRAGLQQRLKILSVENSDPYIERLELELKVINQMGFAGYFLIVADFIQWAKDNGVPVGPGRGSGAGSLVAYALGITDLDPLKYDLLFERFLNSERISMPDFDIDFCMDGRDRVIDYVAQKYGRESVSQIITYGTMAARAVVRDVGRVLGHSYSYVDKIAKLIPFELGITLERALEQDEVLLELYEQDPEVKNLIDLARKLEGIVRNAGKHAGGVVIAPTILTDFSPLYCEPGGKNLVTQFDKYDVEAVGLVKFDFLGLRTLTIIDWAMQTINRARAKNNQEPIDISLIPTDDPKTFSLLKACKTTAVFQLESRGMKDLVKRLQPDCFEEIIALVALFRPGPLQSGMVDDFINRKHGRARVEYPHEKLIPILKPTNGVILYQEQVMQIAQILAGYSLGGADILRRAMGKKKPEEMAQQREVFVKGAIRNGVSEYKATAIFDLMEKFAGYGFNKSHSAAYALLAYQTAWLKAHYPAEFMAAVLSSDMDNTDKMVIFIEECRAMKLTVNKPNINLSEYKFTVSDAGEIVFGLGAIKGVGEAAIESILAVRQEKEFTDLFNFCKKIDLRKVNRRVLEALIKSGAMDELGQSRAEMLASIDNAIRAAEQHLQNTERGQCDLFGNLLDAAELSSVEYTKAEPWTENQRLLFEKETLGFYFSGHPLTQYTEELEYITTSEIAKLNPRNESTVRVAGLVTALRLMNTRRGDRMAFISLADQNARIEVAVFADVYQEYRDLIAKDNLLVVEGEASVDEYSGGYKISANKIFTIAAAREIYAKFLLIDFAGHDTYKKQDLSQEIKSLSNILRQYRGGNCKVCIAYVKDNARALLPLDKQWRIAPTDDLLTNLRDTFGDYVVRVCY
ncbi:MAG: DNA polymerase III subunit alpha [Gammaproteobacteria bacterium]|jgi:DNA polymerase-3 subunit alpha